MVIASLAKAEAVRDTPPTFDGSADTAWNGRPLSSTNRTPVGMTAVAWCSPRSNCPPTFH